MSTSNANPMTQQLESQLRDIVLPEPISWWPPAIGWWVLVGISLLVCLMLIRRHLRARAANRYRRLALDALDQALFDFNQHRHIATYVHTANAVLKRTLQTAPQKPHPAVLTKSGSAWIYQLDTLAPNVLSEHTKQMLAQGQYQTPDSLTDQINVKQLHQELRTWIKTHTINTHPQSDSRSPLKEA